MMFVFEIFGVATVAYLILKGVGEAVVGIRNERYYQQAKLKAEEEQLRDGVEGRPKLRVVAWPERRGRKRGTPGS
jgi:hypothetical protein